MKKIMFALIMISATSFAGRVDITGISKIDLLKALYLRAEPKGYGWKHYIPNDQLSDNDAKEVLSSREGYVDYLRGRAIKVYLSGDLVDTDTYDEYNGAGLAEYIIAGLRK